MPSLYAAFKGFQALAAAAVMATCFLRGAGIGHIRDITLGDNLVPGNASPILYRDFLTPISILVLLLVSPRPKPKSRQVDSAEEMLAARIEDAIQSSSAPCIEDELERARKAMRKSLKAGPDAGSSTAALSPVSRAVRQVPSP